SVPSAVAATPMSCSQIDVQWNASTDSASGVKGYNVYRNGSFLRQVLAPATATSDTGLPDSSSNSYAVSAVDNAGNASALSAPVAATTDSCQTTTPVAPTTTTTTLATDTVAPSMPNGLTGTVVDCGRIDLAWNPSVDTGGSGVPGVHPFGFL